MAGVKFGMDENKDRVCNGDDRFSAESKNKVKMATHY